MRVTSRGSFLRVIVGLLLVGSAVLWVALWSNPAKAGDARSSASLTKVTVGGLRISQNAPLVIGKQKGFYRDAGIDLKIDYSLTNASAFPALLSNRIQFLQFSWGPFISVASNGVPVKAVANLSAAGTSAKTDDEQLLVLNGSPIKRAKDLSGKTIALVTLNGTGEIVVRNAASKAGVSQDKLKFVALLPQDMGTALRAKRVDAVFITEPYMQQLKTQTKVRELGVSVGNFIPGIPKIPIVTSEKYAKANPKIIAAFRKATIRSVIYARKHPKDVKKVLPGLTGQPASAISKMRPTHYSEKIDKAKLQRLSNSMYRFKKLRNQVKINDIVL